MVDLSTVLTAAVGLLGGATGVAAITYRIGKSHGSTAGTGEELHSRIDRLESHMDNRFERVNSRIERLQSRLDDQHTQLRNLLTAVADANGLDASDTELRGEEEFSGDD